nr:sulfotransferase domain-containing protein [uncultured Psychroserpens sp.]
MSKFNKHIIVVGTARSGTSWLSEIIARQYRYRMLFEPEHETRTKKGHLICDKWIETRAEGIESHRYLENVFKNQVDCNWIAQNSNRKFKKHLWPFIPKKYIIKFVRANLSAKYMNDTFNIPVLHVIRNPYDVIRSQKQANFPWLYNLAIFSHQEKLVNLVQEKFNYDITQYERLSDVEKLSLRWCIENVIPLELFNGYNNKSAIVRYENLIENIQEFYDICKAFSIEPIKNLELYYKIPSSKTHPKSDLITNKKHSTNKLPQQDKSRVNKLLDIFETQLYKRE